MPIEKAEQFERYPAIGLRGWKNAEIRRMTFIDEGKDITGDWVGIRYLYHVETPAKIKGETETRELWIAPNSPLSITLSQHVPLNGKTFDITKTTGKTLKETRYTAVEVK